jgi:acyl-CoA hydrolase
MTACGLEAALRSVLRRGSAVALGDGVGQARTLQSGDAVGAVLSRLAREVGDIRLALGWLPAPLEGIEPDAFTEIVTLMPGWGSRSLLQCATARFVPTRLTAVAAVLSDVLCPDVLIIRAAERNGALHFGTEVSWQRGLIDAGVRVMAVVDVNSPAADAGPPLDPAIVDVVGYSDDGPLRIPQKRPDPVHEALADNVLRFVPDCAQLQYGPGPLGTALLNRTTVPLRIDTGLLTDAVVDLDRRGMLIGTPSATYLLGTEKLYDWADGKQILHGTEYTHDAARLSRGGPFVAMNTAIEIDAWGQINVEGVGDKVVGGIGGHPDYCAAAAKIRNGLSIIAMPSSTNGHSPLVSQLSRPVSTPGYDIDLVVTELGHADLRGADWTRRRELITKLFDKGSDQ